MHDSDLNDEKSQIAIDPSDPYHHSKIHGFYADSISPNQISRPMQMIIIFIL